MAKYKIKFELNGVIKHSIVDSLHYSKEKATEFLKDKGAKNLSFFMEPYLPLEIAENSYLFSGEVGFDITLETLLPFLKNESKIFLNSGGGYLQDGLDIYDFVKASKYNPHFEVLGTCASATTLILLSTKNRYMSPNSRLLIHNPWTMVVGDDEDLLDASNDLKKSKLNIANIYAKISGKEIGEIITLMKEEKFLDYDESLALNFVKTKDLDINKNKKEMETKEIEQKIGGIQGALNKVLNLLNPTKNFVAQDVNGVDLDFGEAITSIEEVEVGTTATVNDEPAEGEYTLADGRTLIFEGGAVTEIKTDEDEDEESEEVAELKQEVVELKEQLEAKNTLVDDLKNTVVLIQTDITDFKNSFKEDVPKIVTPPKKDTKNGTKKQTLSYTRK